MAQALLWVQAPSAARGTPHHSSKKEAARIRSHAQCHRQKDGKNSKTSDGRLDSFAQASQQRAHASQNAFIQCSKPNKSLGRLASCEKSSTSTRKQQKRRDRGEKASSSILPISSNAVPPPPRSLPWLWPDLCSSERRSLTFFELRTSREWSGWEDAYFWNVLALQISQRSQTVARSLIALSCLHEYMETVGHVERTRLQNLSSEQSAKATKALLARSEVPYLEALVSCVIMICFHGIRHSRASFLLLRSGSKLLEESKSGHASTEERYLVEKQIRPLLDRLLSGPCRMVDMSAAFRQSIQRHRAQSPSHVLENPVVAASFSTLDEARQSLRQILDWGHDHVPLVLEGKPSETDFFGRLRGLQYAWERAMSESKLSKSARFNRAQKLLRTACIVGMTIIETVDYHRETIFDEYEQDFERAVSLLEQARSPLYTADFGIDSGTFDILVFLGNKCRHPQLRRRALQLLKDGNRIEGDRIASNPATIMEALIALEERDLDVSSSQDIPESSRRRLICGHQYIAQGRIDLFYETADGSRKETCSVSLSAPKFETRGGSLSVVIDAPDAIFGPGCAAYLEDRQSKTYFHLETERFYFPIPKA